MAGKDDKTLTLKGLKKDTDRKLAEHDEKVEFISKTVLELDDCMDEVVMALKDIDTELKTNSKGLKEIEGTSATIATKSNEQDQELAEMRARMDMIAKKMVRVENTQDKIDEVNQQIIMDHTETIDRVTYLKEESHRVTTLLGVVAAIGMGLGLVMTALYLGLA